MGVPVITLRGRCHAHNVSVSLLNAIGLQDEWVAEDTEQYVQLAIQHASNIPALQQVRSELRQKMLTSRLCDAVPFVSDLEDLYHGLWQRWVREGGRQKPLLGMPESRGLLQQQQQQKRHRQPQQQPQQLQHVVAVEGFQHSSVATAAAEVDAEVFFGHSKDSSSGGGSCAGKGGWGKDVQHSGADSSNSSRSSRDVCKNQQGSSQDNSAAVPNGQQPAAAPAAGGAADAGAGAIDSSSDVDNSSSMQKGRKLSSSCDAAATVHSAVAAAAAAVAATVVSDPDDTRQGA
jgi:hypothetical protein